MQLVSIKGRGGWPGQIPYCMQLVSSKGRLALPGPDSMQLVSRKGGLARPDSINHTGMEPLVHHQHTVGWVVYQRFPYQYGVYCWPLPPIPEPYSLPYCNPW